MGAQAEQRVLEGPSFRAPAWKSRAKEDLGCLTTAGLGAPAAGGVSPNGHHPKAAGDGVRCGLDQIPLDPPSGPGPAALPLGSGSKTKTKTNPAFPVCSVILSRDWVGPFWLRSDMLIKRFLAFCETCT